MERFALKVDLSAILRDVYHQKVMILVDPQWQTVAEVERKLKKMFNIELSIGFNSSEGFFIPLEEPVEILKYVDMLIAFKVGELKETAMEQTEKIQKENSRSIVEPEILTTAEFASKKKRKYGFFNGDDFTTSTPNFAKRLKNVSASQDAQISSDAETLKSPQKRKKKKTKTMSPDKGFTALHESNRATPKKSSKEKTKSFIVPDVRNFNKSKSETHIFFDTSVQVEPTEANSPLQQNDELKKSKMEIVFLCELTDSELTGRGRSFQIVQYRSQTENANNCKKPLTLENQQDNVAVLENLTLLKPVNENLGNNKSNSTIVSFESGASYIQQSTKPTDSLISCDESAVIELNESDRSKSQNEKMLASQEIECSESYINESWNGSSLLDDSEKSVKSVPLSDLPNLNDRIIFKIMLLNDKISENFVGICQYVNKRTKSIKIHLVDGHSQMRLLPQKYAGNIDDSNGITILNVKLQEMIEPKVIQA